MKNSKKQNIFSLLLFIIVGGIIGAAAVLIPLKVMEKDTFAEEGILSFLFFLVLLLGSIIVSIFLQIIIHEAGHLVFGLLSGYKFVSFRVGSFTLVKRQSKYKLKRFNVPGTGGQCLMMPPETKNNIFPYKLYNLGGVLFNFIFSAIAIVCLCFLDIPNILFSFFLIFSILGIFLGLLNGIPMKLSGIANDGYNIKSLAKDAISRRIFYIQLNINGLQTDGIRLKEMPKEWFNIPEDIDMQNGFHLSIFLFINALYMDKLDFEKARQCLIDIEPYAENLIGLYQKERICELLFCEMIEECRPEIIEELYTDDIEKYTKQFQNYLFSKKRLLYAYTLIVEKDNLKAEEIFNEAIKMQETYPSIGDAESELEIMEYVRKKFIV